MDIDRSPYVRHLAEIHATPFWLRPVLVAALVAKGWPVEKVREQVADPCCRRRPDRHDGRKDERAEQRGTQVPDTLCDRSWRRMARSE
jgi:hypothetical protein